MDFISELFWTNSRDFVIQRVNGAWLLYDGKTGNFIRDFRTFAAMNKYMQKMRQEKQKEKA
jgi:hypothetical protein